MLLARLTEAAGVSGQEGEIRNVVRDEIKGKCDEVRTDAFGNLIAFKRGLRDGPRVMLAAHMDEVGLMVTYIEKSGMLRFQKIGSIDDRVLVSKAVLIGKDRVPGVIGSKPIHLQEKDEQEKPFKTEQLFIDIGATSKEDAEKLVKRGDGAVFATKYREIGNTCAKAKAFDDRVGCAVLIKVLEEAYEFPLYLVFTTQEEVGARGAGVAAYSIKPDIALVFEGTTASDVPGTKPHGYCTTLGRGPALTHMDLSVIANKAIVRRLEEVAEREGIPFQYRRTGVGGTDAGRIHLQREGIPTAVVSVPARYIHSPVSIINRDDFENTRRLAVSFLRSIQERGLPR
ncbi:MAG: M42 family metallopeptidase [Firmicutes bacterium]|nr:M42 family metallopeptidase [Bacillota bacterium]